MADSSLLSLTLQYFNATTQNVPTVNFSPAAYATPAPTKNSQSRIIAGTTNTTVNLAAFGTVYAFAAKSYDTVNFVEMTYTYTDAASVDHISVFRIPPLAVALLPTTFKISANLVFLANTAPVSLDIALVGI